MTGCGSATGYEFSGAYGVLAGRVGYATESMLFYGKSGLAVARIRHGAGEWDGPDQGYDDDEAVYGRDTRAGLALGGGIDFAVNEKTSLKAEYRYMDFGKKTYSMDNFGTGTFAAKAHTVKFGVNFKF